MEKMDVLFFASQAVYNALKDAFPGRFSTVSPGAVELHTTMDLLTNNLVRGEDKGHPFFIFCLLSFFNEELKCKCNLKEEKK